MALPKQLRMRGPAIPTPPWYTAAARGRLTPVSVASQKKPTVLLVALNNNRTGPSKRDRPVRAVNKLCLTAPPFLDYKVFLCPHADGPSLHCSFEDNPLVTVHFLVLHSKAALRSSNTSLCFPPQRKITLKEEVRHMEVRVLLIFGSRFNPWPE